MMEIPSHFRDGGGSSSLGVYSLSSPSPTSSSNSPAVNMFRGGSLSPTQSPSPFEASPLSSPHMLLRRSSSNASPARSLKAVNRPLSKNRPRKNVKKARKGLIYLKLNLKDSVASGLINPINKVQLSILNTGIIKINDEVSKASGIIPKKPFDLNKNKFDKHLELFNQYKVLLDIEYHVSIFKMLLTLNSCKSVTQTLSFPLPPQQKQMASKNENHTARQAMKEENEAKNVKFKPLPCKFTNICLHQSKQELER